MGILDKASFYLPAGAAYKQSEIWAAKPLTDDAKCNFYRDSVATRTTDCDEVKTQDTALPAYRYRDGVPFLQLEQQSTNLEKNSHGFTGGGTNYTNPNWYENQITITNNTVVSPEGKINGHTLALNAVSSPVWDTYTQYTSLTNGTKYTWSCYVKLGTATNFCVVPNDSTSWDAFNAQSGAIKEFTSADGLSTTEWTRVSVTFTASSSTKANLHLGGHLNSSINQQTTGTIYIWGIQMEEGSVPTSLIKTTGSAATRDETKIRNPNTNLWNNASGVLYADIYFYGGGESQLLGLDSGSVVTRIYVNDTGVIQGHYFESSTYKGNMNHTVDIGRHKIAYKYASGSSKLFIDGVQVGSSSQSFTPQTFTQLRINELWGAYEYGNVDLYEAAVFDQTLNDDELISLTTL